MTGPNDLIAALRQKRAEDDSTSSTRPDLKYKEAPSLEAKIDQVIEKLDRVLACVEQGPGYEKEEPNVTRTSGT